MIMSVSSDMYYYCFTITMWSLFVTSGTGICRVAFLFVRLFFPAMERDSSDSFCSNILSFIFV